MNTENSTPSNDDPQDPDKLDRLGEEKMNPNDRNDESDASEESAPQETYAFRWSSEDMAQEDMEMSKKPREKKSNVFLAVSCLILAAAILASAILTSMPKFSAHGSGTISGGYTERVVYVNGSGDAEEALAVEAAVAKMLPSTVTIIVTTSRGGSGVGSGVILSSDGYIVTNHHVVDGKDTITVRLYGGKRYAAQLIASDPLSDLALLKIAAVDLTPAEWGDSATLLVGETVMAIGTPTGLSYSETVTRGIVSCQGRPVKYKKEDGTLNYTLLMVQTDASVNPGNSGGALLNRNGQVVGIVANKTVFYDNGTAYYADGMGLAIPSNAAKTILDALKNGTTPDRSAFLIPAARLGISGQNVSRETGHTVTGVLVTGHNGAAFDASAKLLEGDIIIRVDGMRIASIAETLTLLEDYAPGTAVTITVVRNGAEMNVEVILGSDALLSDS